MTNATDNRGRSTTLTLSAIFALSAAVLVSSLVHTRLLAQTLSDVNFSSYEGQAIKELQTRGVISGFPDGTFRGDDTVNRAQAAKMLLLAGGYTIEALPNTGQFPDITAGEWYEQFALNAVQYGLMDGYPDGTFRPERTINRAEFLKMMTNAFNLPRNVEYRYADVPVEAWFSAYVGAAEAYNLFLYDQEALFPAQDMSRNEVSWSIYQIVTFVDRNIIVRTPYDYTSTLALKTPNPTVEVAVRPAAPDTQPTEETPPPPPPPVESSSSAVSSAAPTTPPPPPAVSPRDLCSDTDASDLFANGLNQNKKGTTTSQRVTSGVNSYTDVCLPGTTNVLYEYYCDPNGYIASERINCPISCNDGACSNTAGETPEEVDPRRPTGTFQGGSTENPQQINYECSDTDSTDRFELGDNPFSLGTVNGLQTDLSRASFTDVCVNEFFVREFFCTDAGYISEANVACQLGCSIGACVSPGKTGTCSDSDNTDATDFLPSTFGSGSIQVNHPEEGNIGYSDTCTGPTRMDEYYCKPDGRLGVFDIICENGCQDGRCL